MNDTLTVTETPEVQPRDSGASPRAAVTAPALAARCVARAEGRPQAYSVKTKKLAGPAGTDLPALVRRKLDVAVDHLFSLQKPDGHWCAELEGDSILQSEYLLLKWIIEQERDPRLPWITNYLRAQQREDGTWGQYPGSGPDISACVKGYFALKLMGDSPDAPHMQRAKKRILELGGAEKCNSFTKFYFACLGQVSFNACPSIPPEIVYLPKWFYFSLPHVSAWTRTMILPLSIVVTKHPLRKLSPDQGIDELYIDERARHTLVTTNPNAADSPFWTKAFLLIDKVLKFVDRVGTPWRKRAMEKMVDWMVEHVEGSDGLGAIFPPMVYILIALRVMGWSDDHPLILKAHKDLDDFMIVDEAKQQIRLQPCFSPVWDTGIAAYALADAGYDHRDERVRRCGDWLLSKECRKPVDWVDNVKKKVEPSGWFFEYSNPWYPDVDDTVMVAMALRRIAEGQGEEEGHEGTKARRHEGIAPDTRHPTPDTRSSAPYTLNPKPYTLPQPRVQTARTPTHQADDA